MVQYDNGALGDTTMIAVGNSGAGSVDGIDFVPTIGIGPRGDYITILAERDMLDTSLVVGDHAVIGVGGGVHGQGDVTGPGNHTLGWTIGDNGQVDIGGNFAGVDLLIGTSTAASPADATVVNMFRVGYGNPVSDNWTLRGYADVLVEDAFKGDEPPHKFLLEDNAKLSFKDTRYGSWEVLDKASVDASGSFNPETLLIDGGSVSVNRAGVDPRAWNATLRNGARLVSQPTGSPLDPVILFIGTYKPFSDVNSVLAYRGSGSKLITEDLIIGGELIQECAGAAMDIVFSRIFVVESQIVRVLNGETKTIPFEAEGVSVESLGGTLRKFIEGFGPDYDGHNLHNVLFTDSPCVRRWRKLSVEAGPFETAISDESCSTPISGRATPFCAGPPSGGVTEALYVMDLDVAPGATLMAGDPTEPFLINIYYTGTLISNGTIITPDGSPYAPIQLKPTLYGDFNGNGDGDEPDEPGSDTRRFNDAFCTCIGQPNYDILVDWNCDGVIDNLDRDQYNANWNNPGAITTSPCSSDPCN